MPRRIGLLGIVVATVLAAAPAVARADVLALPADTCPDQQMQQPFLTWGDPSSYVLVSGGTFEPGDAPWTLNGGAQVVPGNEPWNVNAGSDGYALSLPPGSSATSPATCIALDRPTLRFFAQSSDSAPLSSLRVDVLFADTLGTLNSLTIGVVSANGSWSPTLPYPILINVLSALSSQYGVVAFQFTPQGSATWQIDDVYVDPWRKG